MPQPIEVKLTQGPDGAKLSFSCPDKSSQMPLSDLLPALRSLTNGVVQAAVQRETGAGRSISCQAGCGACCRQLVPLTLTEARQMPALIAGLEPAHRARVLARFEDAREHFVASGLWDQFDGLDTRTADERMQLSMQYFHEGIACPFLEQDSCSIHPDRPLICRQYLVTSPATNCRDPKPETIVRVALAADVKKAVLRIEASDPAQPGFVPLIRAPYLEASDDESPMRTVPEWLRGLLAEIRRINEENVSRMHARQDPFAADLGA
jgi:Fe-S-cluster containining protein